MIKAVKKTNQKLAVLLLIIAISLSLFPKSTQAAWFDSSWSYRVKITIDSDQIDSDLTDFPVYVRLSDLPSGFHTNVKSDGGDIRVTKSDGTTEVPREVVYYDSGSDEGELHFLADGTLSSTTDTDFYIYYGNSGASDYAEDATYGSENVWSSSFAGSWHLQDDSSAAVDSTSNDNDGTLFGDTATTTGKIGNAYTFDGTGDYVNLGGLGTLGDNMNSTGLSASLWFKTSQTSRYVLLGSNSSTAKWTVFDNNLRGANTTRAVLTSGSTIDAYAASGITFSDDGWHHLAQIFDVSSQTIEFYVDGVLKTTTYTSQNAITDASLSNHYLGALNNGSPILLLTGEIDDVKIYGNLISGDWVSSEYTNQNTPTTFYTVGAEEEASSGGSYNIPFDSVNNAGTRSVSASYILESTIGEIATGFSDSSNYSIHAGYQQMYTSDVSVSVMDNVVMSPTLASITGGTSNGGGQFVVTTTNTAGYAVTINSDSNNGMIGETSGGIIPYLSESSSYVPDYTFSSAPTNSAEFAYTINASSTGEIVQAFRNNGSDTCGTGSTETDDNCWISATTTPRAIINRTSSAANGATSTLNYRVIISSDPQPLILGDVYTSTTTLTVTAS